ncbi:hypothetical protein BcepSauron_085 [Burkholderia phage BcepSauron]|uniref:Uncharacterized protein n=1 Tax=Burkholderia phage BcepSauron TaxID=2530033 RepID=A0A482MLH1_9CAUD|nr:head maturation protease [Burkholderia phage BcepSauron]QBQ74465.1 hypothetical protein BcepSauron_085 [Burkholderia phage BcepSauron]
MKPMMPSAWGKKPQQVRSDSTTTPHEIENLNPRHAPEIDPGEAQHEAIRTGRGDNVGVAQETMDAEKDQTLVSRLDYETWLPFAAQTYKISPRIEDYIIVNTLVCPSDIPNRNGIAFPRDELARFLPPPTNRMSYKAWKGCPVHLEHDNEVHERAYGIILDASFHKVEGYGDGKLWKVMGLLAIDKNKYPDVAQKVLTKEINTYSMGALVEYFTCGYCGASCSTRHTCGHITGTKNVNWKKYRDFDGSTHLAFLNAHGIQPIECSIVKDPAWAPALSDNVVDFGSVARNNSQNSILT